jgi:hypothetical protein
MNAVYQDLVTQFSDQLVDVLCAQESGLARRACLIDADIAEITTQIGLQTTQKLLERVRDQEVKKTTKPG